MPCNTELKTAAQRDRKGRHCLESLERCSILLSIWVRHRIRYCITGFSPVRAPADKLDFNDAARWPIAETAPASDSRETKHKNILVP